MSKKTTKTTKTKNVKKTTKKEKKLSPREEYINSENGNKELREKIWDFGEKNNLSLVTLEPGCFDGGIIRFGKKRDGYAIVYDYMKTAESLAEDYLRFNNSKKKNDKDKIDNYDFDEAFQDAVEWIEYNTLGSYSAYQSCGISPKIVEKDLDTGREKCIAK